MVQNIGADGRVWLRRLDQPRTALPQPAHALRLVLTLEDLLDDAHYHLTSQDDAA